MLWFVIEHHHHHHHPRRRRRRHHHHHQQQQQQQQQQEQQQQQQQQNLMISLSRNQTRLGPPLEIIQGSNACGHVMSFKQPKPCEKTTKNT